MRQQNLEQVDKMSVSPEDSLRHVLKVLDSSATRIVLVTSPNRRLAGVITDGDIRRALLDDASLDTTAACVMTRDPLVEDERTDDLELERRIRERGVLAVPRLRKGAVVGLRFVGEHEHRDVRHNSVVLMAGGKGSRLMPLTENCPKPLLRVGGKPILERVIGQLQDCGFHRFHVCVNYLGEQIERHFGNGSGFGVNIDYVREDRALGTAGALSLIDTDALSPPALVMNADILTTLNFVDVIDFHMHSDVELTVCTREYVHEIPFGVVECRNGSVKDVIEKPSIRRAVNAGIYAIGASVFADLARGKALDMPDLIRSTIARHGSVKSFPVHEYWLDIGRASELERAQSDVLDLAVRDA